MERIEDIEDFYKKELEKIDKEFLENKKKNTSKIKEEIYKNKLKSLQKSYEERFKRYLEEQKNLIIKNKKVRLSDKKDKNPVLKITKLDLKPKFKDELYKELDIKSFRYKIKLRNFLCRFTPNAFIYNYIKFKLDKKNLSNDIKNSSQSLLSETKESANIVFDKIKGRIIKASSIVKGFFSKTSSIIKKLFPQKKVEVKQK